MGAGAEVEGSPAGQEGLGIPGGKAAADCVWAPGSAAEPEAHGSHAAIIRLHVRAAAQEGLPGWPGTFGIKFQGNMLSKTTSKNAT